MDEITVSAKDSMEKWSDKLDELVDLLSKVSSQCSECFEQIMEAANNLRELVEKNKELVPFLKVGVVVGGEMEVCGKKLTGLKAVTGEGEMILKQIIKLSAVVNEKVGV